MTDSLNAWIACDGVIIRWGLAGAATVVRHLATLDAVGDCIVCYHVGSRPYLVTAARFLELYEAWRERRSTVFV